ncbi:hypothetical protein VD0004_g7325 [Verticillium dahliae]|uniref:Uncharacterized protein n=1 Tax=Verticillium dahliae TaxID=27337 RepID=A0A444RYA8_VERDA|nr:hypothetical protein VD0004_g7325 [Verticillium dahliae]PNH74397.1 hypothetical protein VD0001_g3181 [Verticillium dahliae]RXG46141.1 hypothetical protein VDGE_03377 [Verticillium dahliae]
MKFSAVLLLTAVTATLAAPAPAAEEIAPVEAREAAPGGDWHQHRDHCKKECHHGAHHDRCRKRCDDYDYSYKKKVTVTYTYTYCQVHDCGHDWYGRYGYDYYKAYGYKWGYKWDSYKWKRDEVPAAEAEVLAKREAEAAPAPTPAPAPAAAVVAESEAGEVHARDGCTGGGHGGHGCARPKKVHHHYYDNHRQGHHGHDGHRHHDKCRPECDDRKYKYHHYDYCNSCQW